jgi:hypothetical protein
MDTFDNYIPILESSIPIESGFRGLQTHSMLDADLFGARAPIGIPIFPSGDLSWSLLIATIFLNELDETWFPDGVARLVSTGSRPGDSRPYLRFTFSCEDTTLERWVELKVFHGSWTLEVEASREWIIIEWDGHSSAVNSIEASQKRKLKIPKEREFIQYVWELIPKKVTSQSIIEKAPYYISRKKISAYTRNILQKFLIAMVFRNRVILVLFTKYEMRSLQKSLRRR